MKSRFKFPKSLTMLYFVKVIVNFWLGVVQIFFKLKMSEYFVLLCEVTKCLKSLNNEICSSKRAKKTTKTQLTDLNKLVILK